MKLKKISPLSQRDSRWKDKKLGTSTTSTIGNAGCALTCLAMVVNYFGHETDPAKLNDDLVKVKGFYKGNLLVWGAVSQVYPDISIDWNYYIDCPDVPAPLEKIDELLNLKYPVLVKVDFSPQAGIQEHWVLIVGKDNDYIVNDPWDGKEYFFTAKYGDPVKQIYKIVAYKGKVEYEETCEDKLADLETQNASLRQALAEEQLVTNHQGDIIKEQERDNLDFGKQLQESRSQRDEFRRQVEIYQNKVVSLENQLNSITGENNTLKGQISDLERAIKDAHLLTLSKAPTNLVIKELFYRLWSKK